MGGPRIPPPLQAIDLSFAAADVLAFFQMLLGIASTLDDDAPAVGISILEGATIPHPLQDKDKSPLYIEDPGIKASTGMCDNVARSLRPNCWDYICERSQAAVEALGANSPDDASRELLAAEWLQAVFAATSP